MYIRSSGLSRGFGQVVPPTVATAATIAGTLVATTSTILASLAASTTAAGIAAGTVAAGTTATVMGISAAVVPVIGAAIAALIGIGIAIANACKGCGETCIAATQIANQCGALLAKNVDAYTGCPVRFASMQVAALNTFDTTMQALDQACSNPALQAAGQRCISDRQRGACHWKASPGGWNADGTFTPWGAAGSGTACWDWYVGMRDPIANDPFVLPDPVPGSSSTTSTGTPAGSVLSSIPASVGGISTPLLIGGGLLAAYLISEML